MKRREAEGARKADPAYNHYLELLAERGVLGLAAFLLLAGFGHAAGALTRAPQSRRVCDLAARFDAAPGAATGN